MEYKQKFHIHFAIFKCVLILATIQINSLTHIQEYIKIIEILIPWLNTSLLKANNKNIIINLHYTILAFRELSLMDSLLDYLLHQYNLPKRIIQLYYNIDKTQQQTSSNINNIHLHIQLNIIKILNNFLCGSDSFVQELISKENIIHFINYVLSTKNQKYKILKYIYLCIMNISCGTLSLIDELFTKETIYFVIKYTLNHYEEIIKLNGNENKEKALDLYECYKNVCHTIAKVIASVNESDVKKLIEFKDGVVVSLICFGLVCFEEEYEGSICGIKGNVVKKSKDYEEYILDLLKAIYKVFKLRSILDDQDEDGERGDTNSSYVNKLFIHDIEGKLRVLMKSKHKEISHCAIELYDVLMKGN